MVLRSRSSNKRTQRKHTHTGQAPITSGPLFLKQAQIDPAKSWISHRPPDFRHQDLSSMSGKSGLNPYEDRILSNDRKGLTFFKCVGLDFKSQDAIPTEQGIIDAIKYQYKDLTLLN